MTIFGSLLFNRTLNKFLDCRDLKSEEGLELIEKLKSQAKDSIEKVLEIIPTTKKPHSDILKEICQQEINIDSEERFLNNLDSDTTTIRVATKNLLSESSQIHPTKLFKRLHENTSSKTEIIDILEFQRESLAPELFIKNAVRMEKSYATRLFKVATSQAERTDMSALSVDVDSINSPDIKIMLIRFLAAVNKQESADMICQFLTDTSKIIVIESLKSLKGMTVEFDPSPIVRFIPALQEEAQQTAAEILREKATEKTLPSLTLLMTEKSDKYRAIANRVILDHVNEKSLEALLLELDVHDWWGKERGMKYLVNNGNDRLYKAAAGLKSHENEFVRDLAGQLSLKQTTQVGDISEYADALLSDDWTLRENAIEAIGKSENRDSLKLLTRVIQEKPESAVAVLKAIRELGYSKGLEIAAKCIRMKEAAIQRESLLTIRAIISQKHADRVRDVLVRLVPEMQPTVRDTAKEVINDISDRFNLTSLKFQDDKIFETSLLKIEKTKLKPSPSTSSTGELDKTKVVNVDNIDDLDTGDFWMDRFMVVREVGRGAMGRVLLVEDKTVGERLILKFMLPEYTSDGKARERFLRELKYSRKISHPNVIRIHDFLIHQGLSAISMEYFESKGLDYLIKNNKLESPEHSLKILLQVSEGLWEAHQQGVIHRDIKPSNILVNDAGLAKVVDFGIASVNSDSDMTLTKTGMIIGTPAYLSPERAKGLEADHRSDIYALGIIAYCMIGRKLPYTGEPMSLLFQHIEGKADSLHSLDTDISVGISDLVMMMMNADVEKRFQSMEEVRDEIKKLI